MSRIKFANALIFCWGFIALIAGHAAIAQNGAAKDLGQSIEFNRDIRPILSDRCFQCHGPDEKKREAQLRFDLESEAKKDLGGYKAIVERDAGQSELIKRITSIDPDEQMPPPESGKSLDRHEIELLKRWIAAGAPFEKHWSFQPIVSPKLPAVKDSSWVRNEIDHFVLAKLQSKSLKPSPPADASTLIRRVTLDLTGLLPTPEQASEFVNDPSDAAYEKLVDRLLQSKHYGQRIGRHWLDLARYADSNGYANDGLRSIWPYRDWVIDALNDDMPFDQFTIEQLAGDLLPNPTDSQVIATGFNRNTPLQTEGGSDAEQYRVERTKNRTDTTGAVWLGLTVGCAQCHTHKFDPITHKEYYQLYAFFNSVDEPNLTLKNSPELSAKITDTQKRLTEVDKQIADEKSAEAKTVSQSKPQWTTLKFDQVTSVGGATLKRLDDGSYLASGKNPLQDTYELSSQLNEPVIAIRIETLTDPSLPKSGPGRAGNGNFVLAELAIGSDGKDVPISMASADHAQKGYPVIDAYDGDTKSGWAINVSQGKMNANRTAMFTLSREIKKDLQIKITTYDQGNGYNIGRFRISVSKAAPANLPSLDAALQAKRKKLADELKKLERSQDKTLVMRERDQPRASFIQIRGDFLDRGANVLPATLDVLHPMKTKPGVEPTRLDLANWITAPDNPLTARVQVNRMWQHLFGSGLVKTENDFGYQGSLPTHPGLLDYLATQFTNGDHGAERWKMKRVYKMIVMSATYRQASHFRDDLYEVDAANHLLGKQNRYRVEGEIVRDLALSASGLLSEKMGGPSVFPPIPPNVIGTSSAKHRWPTSKGEDRYRRGIYTAIYRANVYPMLLAFDGPDRDNACTRRGQSNTPLQALTIANDAAFMEMAQAFGKRIDEVDRSQSDRIAVAFQIAFSRLPTEQESKRLAEFQTSRLKFYRNDADATKTLAGTDSPELASWIALARVIMNLDEFITRE